MLHFVTALYSEALPIIKACQLKKISGNDRVQIYADEENKYRLLITGVGYVMAISAISTYLTSNKVGENDIMINIGTCCRQVPYGFFEDGEKFPIYLINKLTDGISGRTFYPDVFYVNDLGIAEYEIISTAKPVEKAESDKLALYDMEAAFIYQAAIMSLRADQLYFIKIVTDDGVSAESGDVKDFTKISQKAIEERLGDIQGICERLLKVSDKAPSEIKEELAESIIYKKLSEDIFASETMKNQLLQLFLYSRLEKIDFEGIVSALYTEGLLPCSRKRDGKSIISELSGIILDCQRE